MDAEQLRRRMERRRNMKPRSLGEVLKPLATAQFNAAPSSLVPGEPPMKARSLRFRGRTIVIGRTAFVFDSDGLCVHQSRGRSHEAADFEMLLRTPGIERVLENVTVVGQVQGTASSQAAVEAMVRGADVPKPAAPKQDEPTVKIDPVVIPPQAVPSEAPTPPPVSTPEAPESVQEAAPENGESTPSSEVRPSRRRRAAKTQQTEE